MGYDRIAIKGGKMKTFWMVLVDNTYSTSRKHFSFEEAKTEAERLVRKEGRGASVLQVVAHCGLAPSPIEWETAP